MSLTKYGGVEMEKRYHYITPEDYAKAEKNGVSRRNLNQRVASYGWDIDRAVSTCVRKETAFQPVWDKWKDLATENGVSRKSFYRRVRVSGWSEELAATVVPVPGGQVSPFWSEEDKATMKKNGISRNLANTRVGMLGWTKEDALHTPKLTKEERAERVRQGMKVASERKKAGVYYDGCY